MGTFTMVLAAMAFGFVALMLGMQFWVQRRAKAMNGSKVPQLPGATGQRIAKSGHALVYFFSPGCAACRPLTPRIRALGEKNPGVFAVDVTNDLELARSLNVMATPSTVEIEDGTITGYHIGMLPESVFSRFASA